MSHLSLQLENGVTNYEPGAQLIATAEWSFADPPQSLELRLLWFTRGKGDSDSGIVQQLSFDQPGAAGEKRFGIQLPDSPYSFSGKLISLIWALEIEANPSGDSADIEITLAPEGKEIVLDGAAAAAAEDDYSSPSELDEDEAE